MELSKHERKQFYEALLAAFPKYTDLETMVGLELDENLNTIVEETQLNTAAFKLIKWAEARGKVEHLIRAAYEQNSGNPLLKAFYQKKQPEFSDNKPEDKSEPSQEQYEVTLNKVDNEVEKFKLALKELNYDPQKYLFRQSINQVKPAGTFLIHGQPNYGQRWLVNQFSYDVPYFTDAFYSSLCFKRHRRNIRTLWENLAQQVGSDSASPPDIVEAFYKHWETRTVMLCFRDVDLVDEKYLNNLLLRLWRPLVTRVLQEVQSAEEPNDKNPLLLFLIDNQGCKEKLGIRCINHFDCNSPEIPVEIQELSPFDKTEINRWVKTKKQLFTTQSSNSPYIKTIIQDITERNSKPEKALEAICSWCDLDWYEDIQRKLAL